MKGPGFDWDPRKAAANKGKHDAEDRFLLLGLSSRLRVVVVCHCLRDKGATIRVISARMATRSERQQYFDQK